MITDIERLLLRHFQTVPFHNLNLLCSASPGIMIPGGTCSDKTLAFLSDVRTMGINAFLHSANIGGKEIHRLVRIIINNQTYFADVGNGWPTLRLLPCDDEIEFGCYGMKYRTEIKDNWIKVFHERQGKESLQVEINMLPRSEQAIYRQIESRFSSDIDYPFSQSLRFSMIVGNTFLFLRGHELQRYSETGFSIQKLQTEAISETIEKEFGFNVNSYFDFEKGLENCAANAGG